VSTRIIKAELQDDADIRALLRESPVNGSIRIAFSREPSYFEAVTVEGSVVDTLICRCNEDARVVGLGSRAEKRVFINGRPGTAGYLGGLRILPEYRSGMVLARGYRELQRAHVLGKARLYITSIVEDNEEAYELLTSQRAGLPVYDDYGKYYTMALKPAHKPRRQSSAGMMVRRATPGDIPAILHYLKSYAHQRQFYPCYEARDFDAGLLRGLRAHDLYVCMQGHVLRGCMGLWDQSEFRQQTVHGYVGLLRLLRPAWNAYARVAGIPALPRTGSKMQPALLSMWHIRDEDRNVFNALLDVCLGDAAERRDCDFVLLGMHERDPLLAHARKRRHYPFVSRILLVYWSDGTSDRQALDTRPPYFELGGL